MRLLIALAKSSRWFGASALAAGIGNGVLVSLTLAKLNEAILASTASASVALEFAVLVTAMTGLRWLTLAQFVRLGQTVLARLRMHIARYVAGLPLERIEARGEAKLLAVLTEDVSTVGEGFGLLPWLLVHVAVILGCFGYLAWLSLPVFACVVALLALGSLGYVRRARAAHVQLREARFGEDALFSDFSALLRGAKELRLHAPRRTAFLANALAPSIEHVRLRRSGGLRAHSVLSNWRLGLFFLAIGYVLFVATPLFGISGDVRSGYALMLLYIMLPVNALLEATPALSRMGVALERIAELGVPNELVGEPMSDSNSAPLEAPAPFRSLQLEAVTLRYRMDSQEQEFALGPIDLTLAPAEIVFVVGGNGSGKTTLAKLLVGLYEPTKGRAVLNGVPVGSAQRDAYRALFSAVFTDFHVFDSLLGVARPDLDERALRLLRALELDHKLSIRDGVLSTTELSSGQRKRLALLTAVLEDRPIYVFDEWAADQDPAYKQVFYEQVLPELKRCGKAVVVISHDDRYFHVADRCLKLEAGVFVRMRPPTSVGVPAATPLWGPSSRLVGEA